MATRPGDINANVGIALDAQGMSGNLKALQEQIGSIVNMLNKAGAAAEKAVASTGRVGAESSREIRQLLQQVSRTQSDLLKLGRLNTNNLFGGFTDANKIGQTAAGLDRFFRGLENGSPAVEKLTSRLTLMNQQAAQMLQSGQAVPRDFWDKRLQVQGALESFKKLQTAQDRMQKQISNLSPAGQAKLNPLITQLQTLQSAFDRLSGDKRSGPSLAANLQMQRNITQQIEQQLRLIVQEDKATQNLVNSTRRRAEALLGATASEREADLRAQANRYSTILAGRSGGGQFNDVIGDPSRRLANQISGTDALRRSTEALARTQVQLNAALSTNAPVQRVQTLIARYEQLKDLQALALAQANRENAPGFFGGILQGFQSVARGPGGENVATLGGIGNIIGRVAAYTSAYRAISLVAGSLQSAVSFTIQWEDQLAQLQAISGATGREMENLSDSILRVSQNSANTVQEITEAAKILAQAGYSAKETGSLLQNVVNLSAASGATPAESVDILTSAMGAFDLQVSDATHVTDALVTTLNETKLSAQQVQLGLQYLGATAKENNLTFEDLVSILGAAADAGVRSGSTMATGTRQLLIALQEPTKKLTEELTRIGLTMGDVDVKTRGLVPVLDTLKQHGFDAFSTMETRAAAMYEVLSNNTDEIRRLKEDTERQGSAADAAAKRLDSLNARWVEFKNVMSAAAASIGSLLLPVLKDLLGVINLIFDIVGKVGTGFRELHDTISSFLPDWAKADLTTVLLGKSTEQLNKEVDEQVTRLNEAESATRTQVQSMNSLDGEIQSVINRYDSLSKSHSDLSTEVDRLSNRFPGLRAEFDKTKGGVEGLIEAMFRLSGQMRETLRQKANLDIAQGTVTASSQRGQLLDTTRGLNAKYGSPADHGAGSVAQQASQILQLLEGGNYRAYGFSTIEASRSEGTRRLADYVSKYTTGQYNDFIKSFVTDFQRDMARLTSQQGALGSTQSQIASNRRLVAQATYYSDSSGAYFGPLAQQHAAEANRLISQVQGLDPAVRRQRLASEIKIVEDNIKDLVNEVARLAKTGNAIATQEAQQLLDTERATLNNLKNVGKASDDETRKMEREIRNQGPRSVAVVQAIKDVIPGIRVTDVMRSWERQNFYWRTLPRGQAANPNNAPHVQGRGIDFGREWDTPENRRIIQNVIESMGGGNVGFLNHEGTGRHLHVQWTLVSDPQERRQQSEALREYRLAQQQHQTLLDQDVIVAQATTAAAKRRLAVASKNLGSEGDLSKIEEDFQNVQAKFQEYRAARVEQAKKEAADKHLNGDNLLDYAQQVYNELDAEWEQMVQKGADGIGKVVNKFLEDSMKIADDTFKRNLNDAKTNLETQQGRLQGLDNPRLLGQVPDYTRVVQQHRVDFANQDLIDATYRANQQKIQQIQTTLSILSTNQATLEKTNPELAAKAYELYKDNVLKAQAALLDLNQDQANLKAQAEAIALVPRTWGDAFSQAAQAFQIQHAGEGNIFNHLGEAIDAVHSSFQQFFVDVVTGTSTVGQAFGNMAKAIIKALAEIAAKAIATQIFSLLLSFLPSASHVGTGALLSSDSMFGITVGHKGGLVRNNQVQHFASGGYVASGIPTRDTVPAMLANGEFVMRSSAVQDIGHKLLMDMNNRGASALGKLQGAPTIVNSKPSETNVYVVLPEEKPQLGPNDILAVIHNDVLRNGSTKTLIKRVVHE